jgi:tetratricopeptide (TPR) repeat protein
MKKTYVSLTLLFLAGIMVMPQARVYAAGGSAPQGAAATKQPQWKSRAEYDAFEAFVKETNPSKMISLIQAFLQKFPNSDFKANAYVAEMQTYQQLNNSAKAIKAAKNVLKADPNQLDALAYLSFAFPYTYKPTDADAATQLSEGLAEAQHGLEVLQNFQKPAGVSDAQFQAYIRPKRAIFNTAIGFADLQKKDYADAIAPLQAAIQDRPKDPLTLSLLGQASIYSNPPDFNNGIWYLARSAALAKAANSANAAQLEQFYSQVYESRHGSNQGEKEVLAQAASSATPPAGFNVTPPPKHKPTGDKNLDAFYQLEDALIVGGDTARQNWKQLQGQPIGLVGTVDSVQAGSDPGTTLVNVDITPNAKAKQGVYNIQLQDSSQPDAKLLQPGDPVQFQGTLSAYTATPSFYLTVSDAKINDAVLKMAAERAKANQEKEKARHPVRRRPTGRGR